jgi:hypothetical protein
MIDGACVFVDDDAMNDEVEDRIALLAPWAVKYPYDRWEPSLSNTEITHGFLEEVKDNYSVKVETRFPEKVEDEVPKKENTYAPWAANSYQPYQPYQHYQHYQPYGGAPSLRPSYGGVPGLDSPWSQPRYPQSQSEQSRRPFEPYGGMQVFQGIGGPRY